MAFPDRIRPATNLKPTNKVVRTVRGRRTGVRILVAAATLAGFAVNVVPAQADPGCAGGGPPPGAATRQFDGGTVWITHDGLVGVTVPGGSGSVRVPSASPMPLQALVIDAQGNGQRQLLVSDGRVAHLYVLSGCRITTAVDRQGQPFLFDLENLYGNGTGIGCSDLGDGRHLVGLQVLPQGDVYAVRRTEIDLDGATATIGRSDTLTGTSHQDPVVASGLTISCGALTMPGDGVQQP